MEPNTYDWITEVQITESGYTVNNTVHVPNDPANRDYRAVQEWIAEGNAPRPIRPTPHHEWDGTAWVLALETAKIIKLQEIASARYQAETSGITYNGATIATDRTSQSMITGASLKATQDATYSCKWKTPQGFVTLTAPQIIAIADAVRDHVQGCFDTEATLTAQVEAAQTLEDLEGIVWTTGEPT